MNISPTKICCAGLPGVQTGVRTVHRTGSGDTSQLSHAARAFCTDIRKVDTVYNETSVLCIVIRTR